MQLKNQQLVISQPVLNQVTPFLLLESIFASIFHCFPLLKSEKSPFFSCENTNLTNKPSKNARLLKIVKGGTFYPLSMR